MPICVETKRGYWTGFTFVDDYQDDKCKYYRTESGARFAAKQLTGRKKIQFRPVSIIAEDKIYLDEPIGEANGG